MNRSRQSHSRFGGSPLLKEAEFLIHTSQAVGGCQGEPRKNLSPHRRMGSGTFVKFVPGERVEVEWFLGLGIHRAGLQIQKAHLAENAAL